MEETRGPKVIFFFKDLICYQKLLCRAPKKHFKLVFGSLLSPLRLYQQHNELFERTGAGVTQSKTPKRGILVWSALVPKKQKKQQTKPKTTYHP